VYQPIVDLGTRAVVGYEALARGPVGDPSEMPAVLFSRAAVEGWDLELEWACQYAAVDGAMRRCLGNRLALFVNVEPEHLARPAPPELARLFATAQGRLRVIVEISERKVMANPSELLALCRQVRQRGWGLALDDVGTNRDSLSLLPLVNPDVIKLDLRIVQSPPTRLTAHVLNAVLAHVEATGATVLAEGIETEAHLDAAIGMGAQFGQGWLFGRPAALPGRSTVDVTPTPPLPPVTPVGAPRSPFTSVRDRVTIRRATKPLLIAASKDLERVAFDLDERAVVASCFQTAARFMPSSRTRYRDLVSRCSVVAALGEGLDAQPEPGVRGGTLTAGDPLRREWAIAVLSPHFAGALTAYDLGDDGPDELRRFDYAITHDRELVTLVAASLLDRVQPLAT
jgi:EAL domain-containing protein (putative c-di-GMP-specific phosphodiesterase class I)